MNRTAHRRAVVLAPVLVLLCSGAAGAAAGWTHHELAGATYYDLYVPASLPASTPAPAIVFLHGSGSDPIDYRTSLQDAAEELGTVLILPKSATDLGWGFATDPSIVADSLAGAEDLVDIKPSKISLAGHSAGAGFAIELAYSGPSVYNGVFTMASPFVFIPALGTTDYVPPIRLYYGSEDPNVVTGLGPLTVQFDTLGVPNESEVADGFGHNDAPPDSVLAGFSFLLEQSRTVEITSFGCEDGPNELCLSGGRFRATVAWEAPDGTTGLGNSAELRSDGSGLFWFFSPLNWELLVKVLDGCGINDHFWVFSAASTNLQYTLKVEDLLANTQVTYTNPQGKAAPAVNDTEALATCEVPTSEGSVIRATN